MRRSRFIVAGVIVLLIGYAAFVMSRPRSLVRQWFGHDLPETKAEEEPWLEGRPLHEWVAELTHEKPAFRRQAAEALGAAGRNLPRYKHVGEQLAELLADPDPSVRLAAAMALGQVYVWAKAASQQLYEAARDEDANVRCASLSALAFIINDDDTAAEALRRGLSDTNPAVRLYTVNALAEVGPRAERAMALLLEGLKLQDTDVRRAASAALVDTLSPPQMPTPVDDAAFQSTLEIDHPVELDPTAKAAVAASVAVWNDPDPGVRLNLLKLLGKFGDVIPEARKAIVAALKDPDVVVRAEAATTIGNAMKPVKDAAPQLLDLLDDSDRHVRTRAAIAVGSMRPYPKAAFPRLLEALKNSEETDLLHAAWGLCNLCREPGQLSDESYGDLVLAILRVKPIEAKEPDQRSSAFSATSLLQGCIHPQVGAAIAPRLIEELKSAEGDDKVRIIEGLYLALDAIQHPRNAEGESKAALPKFQHTQHREAIRMAMPLLIAALKSPNDELRMAALRALTVSGPDAEAAVPALCEVLRSNDRDVCLLALIALGQLGPAAKDATPCLIELLKDRKFAYRSTVAYTLGEIGPAANAAVDALLEYLHDRQRWDRDTALLAIKKIDPKAVQQAPVR